MPNKTSKPRPTRWKYQDVRIRFGLSDVEQIRAAAANRGLGFNAFVRHVSAGTARLVLEGCPAERLVGQFLDPESVLTTGPGPAQVGHDG